MNGSAAGSYGAGGQGASGGTRHEADHRNVSASRGVTSPRVPVMAP
jgi:hypothetical protein